ncbi:hypothetical protein LEP1GSC123_1249 [Leptospira borgpetersenii str. 200701203]|uniref:Uncharacterized protein n=1 Tax=Leptospira borgpetersenii str. 200701203 TaxID=1193007 RepID=M3HI05_LEPBO|nr:hypothetical protein LEP1GSC123_1249 [Leptospira borgpetersenii str. 200701203]
MAKKRKSDSAKESYNDEYTKKETILNRIFSLWSIPFWNTSKLSFFMDKNS